MSEQKEVFDAEQGHGNRLHRDNIWLTGTTTAKSRTSGRR